MSQQNIRSDDRQLPAVEVAPAERSRAYPPSSNKPTNGNRKQRVGGRRPPRVNLAPGVPQPRNLSTSGSVPQNDPAYLSALCPHPGAILQPTAQERNIHSSSQGLNEIVRQLHSHLRAENPGFARRVPESAFGYYCATQVYAHMLKKQELNSYRTTTEERDFMRMVYEANLEPPVAIDTLMSSIGNVTLPNGREMKFRLLDRKYHESEDQETFGWFGPVSNQTHYLYASYPCLAVYIERIRQDMLYTQNPEISPNWDLPDGISPEEDGAGLPTANMLGYGPSVKLKPDELRFLQETGFHFRDRQNPNIEWISESDTIPLALQLLQAVQMELRATKQSLRLSPTLVTGSLSQIPLVSGAKPVGPTPEKSQPMEITSPVEVAGCLVVIESAFLFRVKHFVQSRSGSLNNWAIYDWSQYRHVPISWQQTVNLLTDTEPAILNEIEFRATAFNHVNRVADVLAAMNPRRDGKA